MNKAELIAAVAEKTGLSRRTPRRLSTPHLIPSLRLWYPAKRFRWLASAFLMLRSAAFVSIISNPKTREEIEIPASKGSLLQGR